MSQSILIRDGRLIDPSQEIDEVTDVVLADGRVAAIGRQSSGSFEQTIEAGGQIVCPGLIDMHVHLREPGGENAETIESGTHAAAAGGFTAVACMPNTRPALDAPILIAGVLQRAREAAHCRVYPIAAITRGRQGAEMAELALMREAGAVGFSDDGDGIAEAAMCLRAMQTVRPFDGLILQHCEDRSLAAGGCMHAGPTATRLGLPAISPLAEELMIQRDVQLARAAGARYHVCHISTAGAVEIVRRAKADGVRVTTEICPHHLLLTDETCGHYDPNWKMNPPLRSQTDVDVCLEGVRDGTIDCLVTDHAPHSPESKERSFEDAPFGIVGLETALPLFVQALLTPGHLDWPGLIRAMSTLPAELLGVPGGTLKIGAPADVTIIDPQREWTIEPERFRSKSRNTPFAGWKVRGLPTYTIVEAQIRYTVD